MYNTFTNFINPSLAEVLRNAAIDNMLKQLNADIEKDREASGPLVIPEYVYHLTHKKNVGSILKENALCSDWGDIYVCPTMADLRKFKHLVKTSTKNYKVLKIATKGIDTTPWAISFDHNRKYIDADALVYYSDRLEFCETPEVLTFII